MAPTLLFLKEIRARLRASWRHTPSVFAGNSKTDFLSKTQWCGDHFNEKQRGPMLWRYRESREAMTRSSITAIMPDRENRRHPSSCANPSFLDRNGRQNHGFLIENTCRERIFCRKQKGRTPFSKQNRRMRQAYRSDLLKSLRVEPLSL